MKEAAGRKRLCKFNGVGVMRKASGIGGGANRSAGGIGSIVVCVGLEREFESRLERDRLFGGKKGVPHQQVAGRTECGRLEL